jgi:Regulator of chromosome condensation (RCC1) repeat
VVAWGDSSYGQTNVSASATNVVMLAAGDFHELALRRDGSVVAFGCDCWSPQYPGPIDVPMEATNIIGIAAGSADSLALLPDGNVLLWGFILGDGSRSVPSVATNVLALALGCGAQHATALRRDGSVVDWGNPNLAGTNIPPTVTNVVGVAAGSYHSLAVRADGTVISWGDQGPSSVPSSATNIVAVASGWYQNLGLRSDGTLVAWGQLGAPSYRDATNIIAIACGGNHDLALRADGKVFAWGQNDAGQTVVPPWATNIVAIAGARIDSLALSGEGPPTITSPLANRSILTGKSAYFYATAVGATPLSYQWQFNGTNVPGATRAIFTVPNAQPNQAGAYSVIVSNALGTATSPDALLSVLPKEALIEPASVMINGEQFGFAATGPAGTIWTVQESADLITWADLGRLTNATGTMRFSQHLTNSVQTFYRLHLAP